MNTRKWVWLHKWSSLICTLFMLLLCLTGLPLIFKEEIEHLSEEVSASVQPAGTPRMSMNRMAEIARQRYPQHVIQFMTWDEHDHPNMTLVTMAPDAKSPRDKTVNLAMDSTTGQILDEPKREGFLYVMQRLHIDLFAGLAGMLFLGLMGILLLIAMISGLVLYQPFMKRLDFGTVRRRIARQKWLDWHNLFGITAAAWIIVVGLTGVINTLSPIVIGLWQQGQLAAMLAPHQQPPLKQIGALQESLNNAQQAAPHMHISFVAFPGTAFSGTAQYMVLMTGNTPVTARLLKPVLTDGRTGRVLETRELPVYVKTLLLSQPLHFGDYGGLLLKVAWAILDLLMIMVLVSGLWLWYQKRNIRQPVLIDTSPVHSEKLNGNDTTS